MQAIKITNCSDSIFWYRNYVGCTFPLIRIVDDDYITREPSGYINIVKHIDADIVNIDHSLSILFSQGYIPSNN